MSKREVGKSGAYVYLETIASMITGYGFWFIMTRVSTSDVIGISSTVISISVIFTSIVTMGIPNGVQRFLGKSFSEQKIDEAKVFVKASTILISIGIIAFSVIILASQYWMKNIFGISSGLVLVAVLLVISSSMNTLLRSIVISTLKTKILPIVMLVSSSIKILLSIILIMVGMGALGLLIGYTAFQILASIILTVYVVMILKSSTKRQETSLKNASKSTLSASIANWIPTLITTVGAQLGTIIVFGSHGANQAGIFFIAFSVFSAVTGIMFSLFTIAYPALSSMTDGRKKFTWRLTKLSLIISLPFSSWLIFYAKNVMGLFNQSYAEGSSTLGILLSGMMLIAVTTGISTLVYSYGKYRQVLILGLSSSIPRTILYFILVPIYGGIGAALGYTIGSVLGFVVSILVAKKIGIQIIWKELVFLFFIPLGLALALNYLGVNYIASLGIILAISWLILLKIGVITRSDLEDSIGILPYNISNPTLYILNKIGRKLNSAF
jgi:O-antigen/teichoic acid export membrane protein